MHQLPIPLEDNFKQLHDLIKVIRNLLDENPKNIVQIFTSLHPSTAASVLQLMTQNEREEIIAILGTHFDPEILSYLDETVLDNILDLWAIHEVAEKLEHLDRQDAIKILEELHKEERRGLLRALKPQIRVFLEEGLSYAEETAGRLMQHQVVAIPLEWTVDKVTQFIKNANNLPEELEEIFIVNKERAPISKIHISTLLKHSPQTPIAQICTPIEFIFSCNDDQSDVCFKFRKYGIRDAPVIDENKKLVGIILITDIVDLIHQQAQNDMMHSGGLEESDFYRSLIKTSAGRLKWLSFSVFGSFGVAMIVDSFQELMATKVQLVALLTVVLNISAASGVQVVTVVMRAILNRELNTINFKRTLVKELLVAMINGAVLGLFFGLIFGIKTIDFKFSILVIGSLIVSFVGGSIAATLFPVLFNKFGIDPTLSSGALLGCTVDAITTFGFLWLARMIFMG